MVVVGMWKPSINDGNICILLLALVVSAIHLIGAEPLCANNCGQQLANCSCRVTCESLKDCCLDYRNYCLMISPHSGTLMGGTSFMILNRTFEVGSQVVCRFNSEIDTKGYVDENGHAHCISPLLYESGRIPFQLSLDNGQTFLRSGTWLSVHHSKVATSLKSILVNATKWQYYGTPGTGGTLSLTWIAKQLPSNSVNIELWGYHEEGEPYTDAWTAEWKYLYSIGERLPNNGTFTFLPNPADKQYSDWDMGILRIVSNDSSSGEENINAIWSPVHALAWHLDEHFRKDSATWAYNKCIAWHHKEEKLPNFLSEILDCPCTLEQSRADTGRFHTDYGCDIEKGSVCTYHPGAVHCVRGIQGSPQYKAGQQCCYDASGAQVLTADSIGGSTPDRGHDWGSPPYKKPPRVPGFSHWAYDVITFYYCCLWSDNCHYYFTHRPSSDCRTYKPPKAGTAFGDPHFISFDGSKFTFNGKGEYTLLRSEYWSLTVQGRTQQVTYENGTQAPATGISAVAMQENSSDVIEVRTLGYLNQLQVLLNQEVISFNEQSWMDLKGVFVYSAIPENVTVMFPSGAGVEIRGQGQVISVTILLPEKFVNHTEGILGVMNNNPTDDFVFRNGTILPVNATAEQLFEFGASWAIENKTSLFTYDSELLLTNYYHALKHDPGFIPVFSVKEDPSDPLNSDMKEICGSDLFCVFDTLTVRSIQVGNATRTAHQSHEMLNKHLEPVVSCGWLAPPANGKKEGTTYIIGSVVTFSCNTDYIIFGSSERTCQPDGMWSGDTAHCVRDNILGIVLGSVFGSIVLIAVIVLISVKIQGDKRKKKEATDRVEPVYMNENSD